MGAHEQSEHTALVVQRTERPALFALIVQRIGRRIPDPAIEVRILVGAQKENVPPLAGVLIFGLTISEKLDKL